MARKPMTPEQEKAFEREQVQAVFSLYGGELEEEPWVYWTQHESSANHAPLWDKADPMHEKSMMEWAARYWYEGAPEYVESEYREFSSVRTFVQPGGMLTSPHQELYDGQGIWKLKELYSASGEAPCPAQTWDPIKHEEKAEGVRCRKVEQAEAELGDGEECPLCGEKVGEEHGYVYLGDSSYEAVYVLEEREEA